MLPPLLPQSIGKPKNAGPSASEGVVEGGDSEAGVHGGEPHGTGEDAGYHTREHFETPQNATQRYSNSEALVFFNP